MENSKGEKIDKNFTIYAENIRKLKEQEVKNKIKREKEYARLLDSQYLEEEFLNILKRILSLKDKFISLLDILSIGSENDLDEYDFAFDLKNVDIEDYFFKSLKELEKEIAERI